MSRPRPTLLGLLMSASLLLDASARGEEPAVAGGLDRPIEPALAARLINAREQVLLLGLRYGERYPALAEAGRRVRLLEAAAGRAPPWQGSVPVEVAAEAQRHYLDLLDRSVEAQREVIELQGRYGAAHPRLREAHLRARGYAELQRALERMLPPAALGMRDAAKDLCEGVALQGRLDYLRGRYLEKHPRVVAVKTALEALERRRPLSVPPCADRRRAARKAMVDPTIGRLEAGERDAALDALAAHLGTELVCGSEASDEPKPAPTGKARPRARGAR